MFNSLSGLNVQGDIQFTGNLVGNVPGATPSPQKYNSLNVKADGLYSSFGFEDIPASNVNDEGTKDLAETQEFIGTLITQPKPDKVTYYRWLLPIGSTTHVSTSTIIPTDHGRYIFLSQIPLDSEGIAIGCQVLFLGEDGVMCIILASTDGKPGVLPGDLQDLTSKGVQNYNTFTTNGRYKLKGTNDPEAYNLYNVPYLTSSDIVLYVQESHDLYGDTPSWFVTQMVISPMGIMTRTSGENGTYKKWKYINYIADTPEPNLVSANDEGMLSTVVVSMERNVPTSGTDFSGLNAKIVQGTNEILKSTWGDSSSGITETIDGDSFKLQPINSYLTNLPCDANGNFLPYTISSRAYSYNDGSKNVATIQTTIIIQGIATKVYSLATNSVLDRSTTDIAYVIEYIVGSQSTSN